MPDQDPAKLGLEVLRGVSTEGPEVCRRCGSSLGEDSVGPFCSDRCRRLQPIQRHRHLLMVLIIFVVSVAGIGHLQRRELATAVGAPLPAGTQDCARCVNGKIHHFWLGTEQVCPYCGGTGVSGGDPACD